MTKLVGGVAESWTVSPDAKTYTFKLRPNQKFESGAPVTADDMAFSLQRVVILDKTPAFLFTQLGWNKDNVKHLITAPDAIDPAVQDHRELRALARAEPDGHRRRLGRREEGGDGQRDQWRSRQHLAEDAFRNLGPLQAGLLEGQRVRHARGQPQLPSRPAAHEARDRPPRSRARHPAPAAGEGRHRHRAEPAAGSAHAAGRATRTSRSSPSPIPAPGTSG